MWVLTQLFEIFLAFAGFNVLWAIVRALFVREKRIVRAEPEDLPALRRAALDDYTKRIRESLEARAAAVKAG